MTVTVPIIADNGAQSSVVFPAPIVGSSPLIPANRMTIWKPGVTYNGGIPLRTTVYKTLTPLGPTKDDTSQIQAALNSCPANQVVQLAAGTFRVSGANGISINKSSVTLRGAGPGTGATGGKTTEWNGGARTAPLVGGGTGTFLWKYDRATELNGAILYVGNDQAQFSTSTNLAADALQGAFSVSLVSNPGIAIGELIFIDQITDNHPDVFWGLAHDGPGGGSRRWFARQDRSLNQIVQVISVSGNVITFDTPLHCAFRTTYTAQVSRFANPVLTGIGIEDICFMGGQGGDYNGNVAMNLCTYSWIKHIEAYWVVGTSVGLYGCYRCELRDSYIHESGDPSPGGGGYLAGLAYGTSDCLVENNIMWSGNKQDIVKGTGGGNVISYNYMDDAFGAGYPDQPEAGVNAGHYTTPHMELIEGNYSHNYKGDAYWGNSIYITAFRNHFSGIRAAHPPLNTYMSGNVPYMDLNGRTAVDVQAHSYYTNFVGNILGFNGQTLLSYNKGGYSFTQVGWEYEHLNTMDDGTTVIMWRMGSQQNPNDWAWVANTYTTQLRQGNWDWFTKKQTWYANPIGASGAGNGTPQAIPDSLYMMSKPSFFGANAWPWIDPSTGNVGILPAKARFDAGTPNVL